MSDENEEKDEKEKDGKEVAALNKRLRKHDGDALALAAELTAENADLNRQLSAAKGQKPKEGSLLLTPEQATQWNAFLELGKPEDVITAHKAYVAHGKPDEIKTKLEAHEALTTEHATLKKTEQLRQVADSGINGKKLKVSVLQTLDGQAGGLTYEERDVSITKDGKTTTEKAWHVKDKNNNNKWVPLSEYSDTHWKDFGPALLAEESADKGTRVIGSTPDDKSKATGNIYDDIRKQAKAKQEQQQIVAIPIEKRLHMS